MKNYFTHILLLLKRLLLLVVLFSISRLFFLIFNLDRFRTLSIFEIIKILFFGIRFDVCAIVYLNAPFILLHLIPGTIKNHRIYQNVLLFLFFSMNAFLLFLNFIDAKYFAFSNKRSTADIFRFITYGEDFITLLPQYLADYWYVWLSWALLMLIAWWIYPKFSVKKTPLQNTKSLSASSSKQWRHRLTLSTYQILISLVITGLLFVGARGIGMKPISPITAARYTSAQNIPLILNTPFTIMRTFFKKDLEPKHFFEDDELLNLYSPVIRPVLEKDTPFKSYNVIVIILESFSKEYIGALNNDEGFTPFLDSLIAKSLVFENAFANSQRSMAAIPAILASLPSLMDNPYISSHFSSNTINSLASLLKKKNYHTSFFHGGTNGTMGFDNFAYIAGFDHYYGRKEYGNDKDYDGQWGIWDEEFLQYFARKLSMFPEPFFSSVFTLTSHHPYRIPEKYHGKFSEGKLPIHKAIRYTDFALKSFFEEASKTSWFANTLFVITADHTERALEPYYSNKVGIYVIPILYYKPDDPTLIGTRETTTQQSDIMPSVLDYLQYNEPFIAFGNSVFNSEAAHYGINYSNGVYQLIEDDHTLFFDGEKSLELYNLQTDRLLETNVLRISPEIAAKLESKLKAIIQSYNNRLMNNTLIVNEER